MRKIILLILLSLLIVPSAFAATRYARANGNWSATSTWNDVSCVDATETGTVPVDTDNVDLCDHAVVWDYATVPRIPATGRLGTVVAATTGTITFDEDTGTTTCDVEDACAIYFTTGAAGTEHLIQITGTATAGKVTIDGTSCTASAATASKHCIYHNSANTLNADVLPIGSSGASGDGINIAGTGDTNASKGATGGGSSSAYGISQSGGSGSVLTVTGGAVTGSSTNNGAHGIMNAGTGGSAAVVVESGATLVNGSLSGAISGAFQWSATSAAGSWSINGKFYGACPLAADVDTDATTLNNSTGAFDTGTKAGGGGGAWAY